MISAKPCRTCKAPILVVRKAENTTTWTVVDANEVDPTHVYDASKIRVLRDGVYAYRLEHLREALSMDLAFETDGPQTPEDSPGTRCTSAKAVTDGP